LAAGALAADADLEEEAAARLAGLGCGLLPEALARAGAALRPDLEDFALRRGAFLADFAADLRAVLRAAGLDAPFFLACFFAFLAVRAGFFRAMTNPFGLS
jgi:hypothetical protein